MSLMGFPSPASNGLVHRKWVYNGATSKWDLLTYENGLDVTYDTVAPVSSGSTIGDEFFVSSDGTSAGVISAGYIWNGTVWTEQITQVDGSPDGGSTEDF